MRVLRTALAIFGLTAGCSGATYYVGSEIFDSGLDDAGQYGGTQDAGTDGGSDAGQRRRDGGSDDDGGDSENDDGGE